MRDEALEKVIAGIPQQPQRQYGTDDQLEYLHMAANRLGLYDAADRLWPIPQPRPKGWKKPSKELLREKGGKA